MIWPACGNTMSKIITGIALLVFLGLPPSARAAESVWRITRTEWSAADEKQFGDFVASIARSGCTTTSDCLNGPANAYRFTDVKPLSFDADCAKFAYMLRAYFAAKNGLPFSYISQIAGADAWDPRFSAAGNKPKARREVVDHGNGISTSATLSDIRAHVWSATYRMDAAIGRGPVIPDFYSPKIQPGSIHAGTVIYDPNGHVVIVYDVADDGRIRYLEANPDYTVSRGVYGPQFGQSTAWHGGGFKNFRPLKLAGGLRTSLGNYIGGHIVAAGDDEIADASLEQYRGNVAGVEGDGADARFEYAGMPLGFFEFVRASLSGGKADFNPVDELRSQMRSICENFRSRQNFVDTAIRAGIDKKPQPSHLPANIYQSDDPVWESWSTPARDAGIRNSIALLYTDISRMAFTWQPNAPQTGYDGASLKDDLQAAYANESANCSIAYTTSRGVQITIAFDDLLDRLFRMDFDPYHCIERRWGATEPGELAGCADDEVKQHWYHAEQRLRNQTERSYVNRPDFTLSDLEAHASGSGTDHHPPVDIKGLIEHLGEPRMIEMEPVGY